MPETQYSSVLSFLLDEKEYQHERMGLLAQLITSNTGRMAEIIRMKSTYYPISNRNYYLKAKAYSRK